MGISEAKKGETLLLYREGGKEKRVLLLGLGEGSSLTLEGLRKSYASAIKAVKGKRLKTLNILFPISTHLERSLLCKAAMEGAMLCSYSFTAFKSVDAKKDVPIEKICFCGLSNAEKSLLERTEVLIRAVNLTRDLVNGNADDIHVDALIKQATQLGKKFPKIKSTVLDQKRLEKEKMGLMLAVGRGAVRPPALVLLEYRGDPKAKEMTAVVGKGITYDTGGLNLKPTGGMETMKCDMAGAGAVLGIIQAAAELGLKKNLLGVLAIAENAIGPMSYKPGDVYISHSGKSVEISNTDAEGRLVLADALSYIQENYSLTRVIDLATLTGGVVVAIGEESTGLFCNQEGLAKDLESAGERTFDRVWRLPLYPEYKDLLKSGIADIKNASTVRKASPCTAAVFLQEFIKDLPWAHLDIAGTAYLSDPKSYHTTPATGAGVRLLIDYLEHS